MSQRTEWMVAALLLGACGASERVDPRAARIVEEKATLAARKAESDPPEPPPAARAPAELEEPMRLRPMLRAMPRWTDEADPHTEPGQW